MTVPILWDMLQLTAVQRTMLVRSAGEWRKDFPLAKCEAEYSARNKKEKEKTIGKRFED